MRMSRANPDDNRLDHIVVLMFENRSFDNLLGYLYNTGDVPRFEGVQGRSLSNQVPHDVLGTGPHEVEVHPATSMASPYPDPGEEYPHVNTQLFGTVEPDSNRFTDVDDMVAPFNSPASTATPTMSGFLADYVNAFKVQMGRLPNSKEYSQIMACYTPDQVPVLSALARGFATFDHWFCEVPSQTYANRSYFHAARSNGYVLNGHPPGKFALHNDSPTLFNLLEEAGRSWAVYIDPLQILPATGLIHAQRLAPYFATHFRTIFDFYDEARDGRLPNYSFIEPNMFHPHTDMHPHSGAKWAEDLHLLAPDTLIGGEQLLADVYGAVRSSSNANGSNPLNTALIVTFDEHGGTFDHVPPPAVASPEGGSTEQNFRFDRLGVRIPTILVSAWVDEKKVVNNTFHSTSVIRTIRDWWGLSGPLTVRDGSAPSFLQVLSRSSPRPAESWPTASPRKPGLLERAEQEFLRMVEDLESPLEGLERNILGEALAHEATQSGSSLNAGSEKVSHREAHDHFRRVAASYFPGVTRGRQR